MTPLLLFNFALSFLQINNKNSALYDLMPFSFGVDLNEAASLSLPFDVLAQSGGFEECWLTDAKVTCQQKAAYDQWQNEDFLVLSFNSAGCDVGEITRAVYQQALSEAQSLGYAELIRTWNYFPRINETENGLERYQTFCVARQETLSQYPEYQKQNPAATAIGTHHELNSFVFIFAKTEGVPLENKRQMPAWEYPEQYAPRQPRFARAMWHSGVLMCSGTASVVGHETKHEGNLEKQFNETLLNVGVLLQQSGGNMSLQEGVYRFYLREPDQAQFIRQLLAEVGIRQFVILAADVCRKNLLIECEAVFQK